LRVRLGAFHRQKPLFALLLIFLSGCGSAENPVLEGVVERVYTTEPNANVSIENRDGAVLIYSSEGNELQVRAVKKAYSQERLNQIAIDVSIKSGAVSVSTKFPPQPKWALSDRSGTVDYTIVLPANVGTCALDLNAGEVLLDSMRGREVRARLKDGRIFSRNCFTNLDLAMSRGTLTLSYDWWEEQTLSVRATVAQGNAWAFLPTDAAFHLLAHAAHGKIANDFNDVPVPTTGSAKMMNIDQVVNGGGQATIDIRVEKGNIKIAEANP
jgi:hypothetical protein